jgi:hypothetical protein
MTQPTDYTQRAAHVAAQAQDTAARRLLEHDDTGGFGDIATSAHGSATWMHVPARGRLRIAILCPRAYRYDGHWHDGSMHNCPPDRCQYCLRGIGRQTKFVLAASDLDLGGAGLIELTPATAQIIAAQFHEAGYLRGLTFALRHETGRSNGRILIEPTGPVLSLATLPDSPDIAAAMQAQWAARGEI